MVKPLSRSVNEWLDATTRQVTPKGDRTTVVPVKDGETVDVMVAGSQHFGSGGYSGAAYYTGEEPEYVEDLPEERDGSVSKSFARFLMRAPSVVHVAEGDGIGDGRSWSTTYVCATEAQIATAQDELAVSRAADCQDADLEPLRAQLLAKWQDAASHCAQYHRNGSCYAGRRAGEMHADFDRSVEARACLSGEIDEARVSRFSPEVIRAFRRVALMPEAQRLAFWRAAELAAGRR